MRSFLDIDNAPKARESWV